MQILGSVQAAPLQVIPSTDTHDPSVTDCTTPDYRYFKIKIKVLNESEVELARYELLDIETKLKLRGFKVLQVDYSKFEIFIYSLEPKSALDFSTSDLDIFEKEPIECFESAQL